MSVGGHSNDADPAGPPYCRVRRGRRQGSGQNCPAAVVLLTIRGVRPPWRGANQRVPVPCGRAAVPKCGV